MTRSQLEHIIRAACSIADDDELIVIGSQAILAQYPQAPAELLVSMEADVCPKHFPERADLIEGAIGELSMFHETFGYYADGVGDPMPIFPDGWQERFVQITSAGTNGKTGHAAELHDVMISKYIANRDKDRAYNATALKHGLALPDTLKARLAMTRVEPEVRARIAAQIAADST